MPGLVTEVCSIGAFVRVADGIEGLVPLDELVLTHVTRPGDAVEVGDEATVVVTEVDRTRRRLSLSPRPA
ncbi:S1 RNA-binding domain-containing protein [Streptomyces sp. NPDC058664]|uniref:S1 RNA-binding domain-containing protein n=1 Tax=unclassified Streptomyces TaxID=2593676 RepID=UPI0036508F5D